MFQILKNRALICLSVSLSEKFCIFIVWLSHSRAHSFLSIFSKFYTEIVQPILWKPVENEGILSIRPSVSWSIIYPHQTQNQNQLSNHNQILIISFYWLDQQIPRNLQSSVCPSVCQSVRKILHFFFVQLAHFRAQSIPSIFSKFDTEIVQPILWKPV